MKKQIFNVRHYNIPTICSEYNTKISVMGQQEDDFESAVLLTGNC